MGHMPTNLFLLLQKAERMLGQLYQSEARTILNSCDHDPVFHVQLALPLGSHYRALTVTTIASRHVIIQPSSPVNRLATWSVQ